MRDAVARAAVRGFKRLVFALEAKTLRRLGFTGAFRPDGSEQVYSPDTVLVLAPEELELPRTWPAAFRFTGGVRYAPPGRPGRWGSDAVEEEDVSGSTDVSGAPAARTGARTVRVLVSCGTHLGAETAELVEAAAAAARIAPELDLHVTLGGSARPDPLPRGIRVHDYVDYGTLDDYDVIVHHGGTGIALAAVAAGKPSIVVPRDYDQPDVAARLVHHGLGRRVDPKLLRRPDAGEVLACTIRAEADPSPERVAALARFAPIARRDGAAASADLIEAAWREAVGRPAAGIL
ncbi:glycosyltransferase [Agromyces protaetiae]|uniref:glycosyltransferase n=1 Tax=Agromyces protaetiae TaxID=2509455 RepID=UPI0013EA7E51|nr:nucleotide disphospho-sugar-binding domain-containing protein [Agromyces protaetiae]